MDEPKSSLSTIVIVSAVAGVILLIIAAVGLKGTEEKVALPVNVEEFSDFQCPACKSYYPVTKSIIAEFTDAEITFIYKHYPLQSVHHNAYKAAIGAEAAREQNKFSEFHDLLFEKQDEFSPKDVTLTDEMLLGYAQELQMDLEKYKQDLVKPEIQSRVDADIAEGESRNVNATPTFFVNGKIVIFKDTDDVEQKLRNVIKDKVALAKKQLAEAQKNTQN